MPVGKRGEIESYDESYNPYSAKNSYQHNPTHSEGVSQSKAKEIMKHGEVRGHKLTPKQRGFFGARAGGAPAKRKGSW